MSPPADFSLTGKPGTTHDVNIRSLSERYHDFYVTAEKDRGWYLYANRVWRREWERFRLTELGDNRVHIWAFANGKYISADFYDGSPFYPGFPGFPGQPNPAIQQLMSGALRASSDGAGERETFILEPLGNNAFGIRALHNGKYVTAVLNEEARLVARNPTRNSWETFEIRPAVYDPIPTPPGVGHPQMPYGGSIFTKRIPAWE